MRQVLVRGHQADGDAMGAAGGAGDLAGEEQPLGGRGILEGDRHHLAADDLLVLIDPP